MCSLSLLFLVIVLFSSVSALPARRVRRQTNNVGPAYQQRSAWWNAPSGSIPGTSYYRAESDPNYGSYISHPDRPNGGSGIVPISYNPNSKYFINSNQPFNSFSNRNPSWQSSGKTDYNRLPSNPYLPGTSGWYATGGDRWYNNGQSLVNSCCLLIISMLFVSLSQ